MDEEYLAKTEEYRWKPVIVTDNPDQYVQLAMDVAYKMIGFRGPVTNGIALHLLGSSEFLRRAEAGFLNFHSKIQGARKDVKKFEDVEAVRRLAGDYYVELVDELYPLFLTKPNKHVVESIKKEDGFWD